MKRDFTRRSFLVSTAAAGAGLAALTPESLSAGAGPVAAAGSPLKIGIVTYNIAKDWDLPTIIKNCTETKFDGVELRTGHAH